MKTSRWTVEVRIWVESEEGKGAIFLFTIPKQKEKWETDPKPVLILIIDNEHVNVMLAKTSFIVLRDNSNQSAALV